MKIRVAAFSRRRSSQSPSSSSSGRAHSRAICRWRKPEIGRHVDQAAASGFTQYIQGYMDRNEIAGAITLVARHGKIVHFDAQGFRYKEENAPMQKDTIFSLMSMTKPIVSTALMMLWEEGRFMLDDPISKWLPSYANKQVLDTVSGPPRCRDGR